MRHATVILFLFALNLSRFCIGSSPHPLNKQKKDAFFRHPTHRPPTTRSWLSGVTTSNSQTQWSDMILTTRGGSRSDDGLRDLPDRVDEAAIKMLVKEIMQDKETNIFLLPDSMEAALYRNTVRLTLNAIYENWKYYDGQPVLLGLRFRLRHYPASLGKTDAFRKAAESSHIDMKLLEEVVDRLLQNKNINQPLIPDVLERQIYINCLKVVMRILDIVLGSMRMTFCGHTIGSFLTNNTSSVFAENSVRRASSVLSKVSSEDLLRYQEESGVMEQDSGWFSFWGKQKRALMNQVHATMFGLVVQILQDMLDQSAIELVGVGKIVMDLVPSSGNQTTFPNDQTPPTGGPQQLVTSTKKPMSTFVAGMSVGAILVVLLMKQLESPDGTINLGELFQSLSARLRSLVP